MSLSINYSIEYSNTTISDYLTDWSAFFGDINHREGEVVIGENSGGFNPGPLSGTQYAVSGNGGAAAFIAGGDLAYTLFSPPAHTLYGTLDSVQLGSGLSGGRGNPFELSESEVSFEGLDVYSARDEGHGGLVHQAIYGLMSGDSTALANVLDDILSDYGVSIDSTFDEVAAGLAEPIGLVAEAVGVAEVVEDYAIAA